MASEDKDDAALLTEYVELGRSEGYSAANWSGGSWNKQAAARMQEVREEILLRMAAQHTRHPAPARKAD